MILYAGGASTTRARGGAASLMRDHTYQILNDIYAERIRQEEAEGFTSEGDDGEVMAELGRMAAAYLLSAASQSVPGHLPVRQVLYHRAQLVWPVVDGSFKPHPARRALVIAGALTMSEIERWDRANGFLYPIERQDRRFSQSRAAVDAAFPSGRVLP